MQQSQELHINPVLWLMTSVKGKYQETLALTGLDPFLSVSSLCLHLPPHSFRFLFSPLLLPSYFALKSFVLPAILLVFPLSSSPLIMHPEA